MPLAERSRTSFCEVGQSGASIFTGFSSAKVRCVYSPITATLKRVAVADKVLVLTYILDTAFAGELPSLNDHRSLTRSRKKINNAIAGGERRKGNP